MTVSDRIGVPADRKGRRIYCAAYLAALMEARGYILQVRNFDFKHSALDALDTKLCKLMDAIILENAEMQKTDENPMQYNPDSEWRS